MHPHARGERASQSAGGSGGLLGWSRPARSDARKGKRGRGRACAQVAGARAWTWERTAAARQGSRGGGDQLAVVAVAVKDAVEVDAVVEVRLHEHPVLRASPPTKQRSTATAASWIAVWHHHRHHDRFLVDSSGQSWRASNRYLSYVIVTAI